jgi:hypothetical protein
MGLSLDKTFARLLVASTHRRCYSTQRATTTINRQPFSNTGSYRVMPSSIPGIGRSLKHRRISPHGKRHTALIEEHKVTARCCQLDSHAAQGRCPIRAGACQVFVALRRYASQFSRPIAGIWIPGTARSDCRVESALFGSPEPLGFLPEIVVLGLDLGSQRRDSAISTQGNSKASDKASDQVDACFFLLGRQLFRVLTREPLGTSQLEY